MRIHRHAGQEEVYLVIEGQLTVLVEGVPHTLTAGELMRVAPETREPIEHVHGRTPTGTCGSA